MTIVRAATAADSENIYRVHVAAVRGLPSGAEGKQGIERWLATREPSAYAAEMAQEVFIVAEDGPQLIGWGALSVGKEEITNVFVDPLCHRRGIGTQIVSALERSAREAGMAAVKLQATGTAIDFYRAIGYESDPPVAPGATWALMKKNL